mmetsp:Transcript_10032/g.22141  ORF Transcript_10032/g.22141 Transcript_10032/m.22141 type:complete len:465 (+) Transcript_10032:133-1527(+)|eukprot:CAMPEP_0206430588 /NCGR_PEP_ID=MMETSP0324_2-20121206/6898_1 /ASSEMBLY_ACC=CAM_ASM_000836 /TAXON_ID=2866 /ORGANISM="Crypthecodinium cohnii, Strain Seligo" /LENGTH=464 /DNA_ID=CAMNT_0053896433 /DNA_START=63 /DNA_END=1457 /DNA_ORIENTATION=-
MGNSCKAVVVERESQSGSGAPSSAAPGEAAAPEDESSELRAREARWKELERRYKTQLQQLEEANETLQAENRSLQSLTEELLEKGGGGDGGARSDGPGGVDEETLNKALEEVDQLRAQVEEMEDTCSQAESLRKTLQEMEAEKEELEEKLSSATRNAGAGRDMAALQAERRALQDSKAELEESLAAARTRIEDLEEQLHSQEEKAKVASAQTSEISTLKSENQSLTQRCKALEALAEQACARAEEVALKFEEAEALRSSSPSPNRFPSAEKEGQLSVGASDATFEVEGRPLSASAASSAPHPATRPLDASRILQSQTSPVRHSLPGSARGSQANGIAGLAGATAASSAVGRSLGGIVGGSLTPTTMAVPVVFPYKDPSTPPKPINAVGPTGYPLTAVSSGTSPPTSAHHVHHYPTVTVAQPSSPTTLYGAQPRVLQPMGLDQYPYRSTIEPSMPAGPSVGVWGR